jgi:hypothetical protein
MTTAHELQQIADRAQRVDTWSWDLAISRHHDPDLGKYAAEVHMLALDTMELLQRIAGRR